jgi:hypothetical protein
MEILDKAIENLERKKEEYRVELKKQEELIS